MAEIISSIEYIQIRVPVTEAEGVAGKIDGFGCVRIRTASGETGYGFGDMDTRLIAHIRESLVGADPREIAIHSAGSLAVTPGPSNNETRTIAVVEHALWDLLGKIAGLPISTLLGGSRDRVPCYLTCVWLGRDDQSHITPSEQAEQALEYKMMGFRAMKIRIWRPDPMEDVEAVRRIRELCGPDFNVMVDRTAHHPGSTWNLASALRVAAALEEAGATWFEEPMDREDRVGLARLAAESRIPITGGEAEAGELRFAEYLSQRCFDIVQPDALGSGGIHVCQKVAALSESIGIPCILHGSHGAGLAAPLQVCAGISNCSWLEIALVRPPLTPQEMWEPLERIVQSPPLFDIEDGCVLVPDKPGLGIDLDEEAIEECRVP